MGSDDHQQMLGEVNNNQKFEKLKKIISDIYTNKSVIFSNWSAEGDSYIRNGPSLSVQLIMQVS